MDLDLIQAMLNPTAATEEAKRLAAKQAQRRATLDPQLARSAWRAYIRQAASQRAGSRFPAPCDRDSA